MASANNDQEESKGEKSYDATKVEELRALIDNSNVGGIIGKGGVNIKKVREATGAFLSILKSDVRSISDRILLIKGNIGQQCEAIVAVSKLVAENNAANDSGKSQNKDDESFEFKLLVHKSAVGAIIGKGGQSIKDTQTATGARIKISNDVLPGSTEKTVALLGTPTAVSQAAHKILLQLRENPLHAGTQVIPYVPGQQLMGGLNYLQQLPGMNLGFGIMSNFNQGNRQSGSRNQQQSSQQSSGASQQPQQAQGQTQGQTQTHKLVVPTSCAGLIIGRQGATIRDIRTQSLCSISIADSASATPDERVVTIQGSLIGINAAVYMIKTLVDAYQNAPPARGAGGDRRSKGSQDEQN